VGGEGTREQTQKVTRNNTEIAGIGKGPMAKGEPGKRKRENGFWAGGCTARDNGPGSEVFPSKHRRRKKKEFKERETIGARTVITGEVPRRKTKKVRLLEDCFEQVTIRSTKPKGSKIKKLKRLPAGKKKLGQSSHNYRKRGEEKFCVPGGSTALMKAKERFQGGKQMSHARTCQQVQKT